MTNLATERRPITWSHVAISRWYAKNVVDGIYAEVDAVSIHARGNA
jgi:hypothetical protein